MSVHWGGRGPGHVSRWPKGAALWSPADLGASLLADWDAEVASSLTLAGALVNSWADVKNGYTPSQSSTGFKPAYSATSFNGRPGLTFDGLDDYLELLNPLLPSGATPYEIWLLSDQTALPADASFRTAISTGGATSAVRRGIQRAQGSGVNVAQGSSGNGTTITVVAPGDFSGRHVVRHAIGATQSITSMDGNAGTPVASVPTTGTERLRIGSTSNTAPGGYWQGGINRILFTAPLTTDQAALMLAYLKSRGGIP